MDSLKFWVTLERSALVILTVVLACISWVVYGPMRSFFPARKSASASHVNLRVFSAVLKEVNATPDGPIAQALRLIATYEPRATPGQRKAVLASLQQPRQRIVSQGDRLDATLWSIPIACSVAHVDADSIRLKLENGVEELIRISAKAGSGSGVPTAGSTDSRSSTGGGWRESNVLESNEFGERVGENRWVMSREKLEAYKRAVWDDPERVDNLFTSLKPVYRDNEITGYELDMVGEADFFKAIGLQQGDQIRQVNHMPMNSVRKAESMIRQFGAGELNAFVFEVERAGQRVEMTYIID